MKLAILTLLALSCAPLAQQCRADDRLVADLYTKHTSPCESAYAKVCVPWEQPKRLSWQHDFDDKGDFSSDVGIGTNSYGNFSMDIGGLWQPVKYGTVRGGVFAALVSGYTCDQLRTCMLVGGLVGTLEVKGASMQLLYVPSIGSGTVSVWQVRAGFAF